MWLSLKIRIYFFFIIIRKENMSKKGMLTTVDNPFNPINDFDNWYAEDIRLSRINDCIDTCSLLAQIVPDSPYNEAALNDALLDEAMETIVRLDPTKRYCIFYESGTDGDGGEEQQIAS